MSGILIVTLLILSAAIIWSVFSLIRLRDGRMGILTLILILIATGQTFLLLNEEFIQLKSMSIYLAGFSQLFVSIMAIIAVISLNHLLAEHTFTHAALKSQQKFMRGILRAMPVVTFKIDEKGNIRETDGAGLKRIGMELLQNNGTHFLQESPKYKEHVNRALAGESVQYESHGASEHGPWWYRNFLTLDANGKKEALGFAIDVTEQKLAIDALQKSEATNQALLQVIPHLMFRIDEDGTFLDFTSTNHANTVLPSRKFIGKKISDVLPEDIAQKTMQHLQQTLKTGQVNTFEYQLQKNGHTLNYQAHLIGSGKNEIFAIVRNVTEQKRVQRAVQEYEERHRALIENAPFCVFEINMARNLTFINSAGFKLMGFKRRNQIIGKSFFDFIAREDHARIEVQINKACHSITAECEYVSLCGSGPRIFASSFIPMKKTNGSVETVMIITQDITERKKTEGLLRKLYHAVEQSPSMVMITDPLGVIEYVNPKFVQITGYPSHEILGTNVNELGDIISEDYEKIWPILNAGKEWRGEFYNRKKNGEFYWEYASISSIKNKEGVITHCIKVAEDLTARKKLEEQLFQAQKMEAIGRLAGGVAHDFNNLLTAISGYTDFLLSEIKHNDPNRQDIIEIQNAGKRAALLTRQLLAFSRKQMLQQEMVDVNDTIKDLHNMLKRVIGENIDLKINLELNLSPIWADAGQIQQALLNLCINSRDAMPKGGKLNIETQNLSNKQIKELAVPLKTDTNYVQINIIDTGIGMDQKTLKQIFEPFYTTKEMGKGTGLGLSVVYGIVKQHNGHIEVESKLGKGTKFKLYLPADPDAEVGKKNKDKLPKLQEYSKTILVVEDDETVRNVAVRILKSLDYKILMAQDGSEAVKVFEKENDRIDLIILDVVMPKISGPEAYEKMRKIKSNIPVIFVTGYDVRSEINDLRLNSDTPITVLQKPYSKDSLAEKVDELLTN